jgi:hypothetical protein
VKYSPTGSIASAPVCGCCTSIVTTPLAANAIPPNSAAPSVQPIRRRNSALNSAVTNSFDNALPSTASLNGSTYTSATNGENTPDWKFATSGSPPAEYGFHSGQRPAASSPPANRAQGCICTVGSPSSVFDVT